MGKAKKREKNVAEETGAQIKSDANKAYNLLIKQYEGLAGEDNPALKQSDMEQEQGRAQFEAASGALQQKIGQTGLAGSGSATSARENLSEQFEQRQAFTREAALDTQGGELDRIVMEMQNIVSSTNAALAAQTKLTKSQRTYTPPRPVEDFETVG